VIGTDGLFDNVFDEDILDKCVKPSFGGTGETDLQRIADCLALHAEVNSYNTTYVGPWNKGAIEANRPAEDCAGGKEDDITVVAAWVLQESMNLAGISNESDECTTALTAPSRSPTGTTASDASSEAGSTARARTKTS